MTHFGFWGEEMIYNYLLLFLNASTKYQQHCYTYICIQRKNCLQCTCRETRCFSTLFLYSSRVRYEIPNDTFTLSAHIVERLSVIATFLQHLRSRALVVWLCHHTNHAYQYFLDVLHRTPPLFAPFIPRVILARRMHWNAPCRPNVVWVPDGSRKSHLWRVHWVVFWKRQECMKAPTLVRRAVWPQHQAFPLEKVLLVDRTRRQSLRWVFCDLLVLSQQPSRRHGGRHF